MTHQFYCHYTGKDGRTPRRRLQELTFFDLVPAIGNSSSSPTPLWVEVLQRNHNGHPYDMYLIHAQLSDDVVIYTEHVKISPSCRLLNDFVKGTIASPTLRSACAEMLALHRQLTNFTKYLLSHHDRITPPVLAAYQEARPKEYKKLLRHYMY